MPEFEGLSISFDVLCWFCKVCDLFESACETVSSAYSLDWQGGLFAHAEVPGSMGVHITGVLLSMLFSAAKGPTRNTLKRTLYA